MKFLITALIVILASLSLSSQVLEIQTKGMLNCRSNTLSVNLKTSTITLRDVDSANYSIIIQSKRDATLTLVEDFPIDGKYSTYGEYQIKKGIPFKIPYNYRKNFPRACLLLSDQKENKWEITILQDVEHFETSIIAKVWAVMVYGHYNCYPKK